MTLLRTCDACNTVEERVFTDSYTGKSLCLGCLTSIGPRISLDVEHDNLEQLMEEVA